MADKTPAVAVLLEKYVFLVATHCIDQVEAELQTRLIKLLLEVGQESPRDEQVTLKPRPGTKPEKN